MFTLTPKWSGDFEKLWKSICKRNVWFIKLRYVAVASLLIFAFFSKKAFNIHFAPVQKNVLVYIAVLLFVYNVALQRLRSKINIKNVGKFTPLHLSLLQITIDLLLLTVIVYFTGGIESPFLPFFIFHMIIGSLILPGAVVYAAAFSVTLLISAISLLEYSGLLNHYCIYGLLNGELYNRFPFVSVTLLTFVITLFFSVYLANKIARQLYVQEEELIKALEELRSLNEKKQKYVMGVMHEIKSPVSASQSIVELMLNGYLGKIPERIEEKLLRIKLRNNEAIEMINDILRISRLHLSETNDLEEIDPVELLKEEKEKIIERARKKNIRVELKTFSGKQRKIICDARVLRLAISNVLSNAVKYTPTDGKIIIGGTFASDSVEIKICDNGKGIPPEEREKIFVPFYRLKRDQGEVEGTGFGLALVKEIINQHKGEITIQSPSDFGTPENPGTCVLITLPLNVQIKEEEKNEECN